MVRDAGKAPDAGIRFQEFLHLPSVKALSLDKNPLWLREARVVSPLYFPYREKYPRSRVDTLVICACMQGPTYAPSQSDMAVEDAEWKRIRGRRLGSK